MKMPMHQDNPCLIQRVESGGHNTVGDPVCRISTAEVTIIDAGFSRQLRARCSGICDPSRCFILSTVKPRLLSALRSVPRCGARSSSMPQSAELAALDATPSIPPAYYCDSSIKAVHGLRSTLFSEFTLNLRKQTEVDNCAGQQRSAT